ncbi:MAG: hypothetical protein HKM94_07690, partial [Halobacteria archaeon]|nr:hypothetical protein [Halobacteria archaeon]
LMCSLTAPAISLAEVELSGYLTFATTYADSDNTNDVSYYNALANTDHWDFDTRNNHVGVQIYSALTDKVSVTVALTAEGGQSGYSVEPEWAYGTYQFNDDWGLRMGRFKGPFYMVSDYRDVGYAYPWVRPPEEVYSTNPIKSINGLDLIFQKTHQDVNYLVEIYGGSGTNTSLVNPNAVGAICPTCPPGFTDLELPFETYNSVGFNASVGIEAITFRAGYYNTKVDVPGFFTGESGSFAGLGLIVDWRNFVLYSEYIQRDTDPNVDAAFPDQNAWYVTLGYRYQPLLPYLTFAELDEGADKTPFALRQSSVALGLRWDIDDAAAVKFEVKQIDPDVSDFSSIGGPTGKIGLWDAPQVDKGNVYTITFDTIF